MTRADQRKFHYIYRVTRIDGKYYIGLHSTDNLDDGYFGSGQLLWKSIKKHGKEKHSKEILEFFPSRSELKIRERELVNESVLQDPLCMNLCLGGNGGDNLHEWRETATPQMIHEYAARGGKAHAERLKTDPKYSAAYSEKQRAKTFKLTDEQCKKISESKLGKPRSEELKFRLAELAMQRPKFVCQHCHTEAQAGNFARWHGENCKLKPVKCT
jgi:hypothetical protein